MLKLGGLFILGRASKLVNCLWHYVCVVCTSEENVTNCQQYINVELPSRKFPPRVNRVFHALWTKIHANLWLRMETPHANAKCIPILSNIRTISSCMTTRIATIMPAIRTTLMTTVMG